MTFSFFLLAVDKAPKTGLQMRMERAEFLVRQAFEEDEAGNETEAADLYMEAAELCIDLVGYTFTSTFPMVTLLHMLWLVNTCTDSGPVC